MIVIQQNINKYIYISECFSIWFVEVICVTPLSRRFTFKCKHT